MELSDIVRYFLTTISAIDFAPSFGEQKRPRLSGWTSKRPGLKSSHMSLLSYPSEVPAIIEDLAAAAAGKLG
jgi:hypothetical protein